VIFEEKEFLQVAFIVGVARKRNHFPSPSSHPRNSPFTHKPLTRLTSRWRRDAQRAYHNALEDFS
jgi:hypothetical protein